MRDMRRLSSDTTFFTFSAKGKQNVCLDGLDAVYWSSSQGAKFYFETMGQVLPKWTWQYVGNWMAVHWSTSVHRDSERQLHFDTKFEHEEMVLVA